VAVRVPNHEKALALLDILDYPLAAPSANPFGCISPTTSEHVHDYFGRSLPIILEGGACTKGLESTIVGFDQNRPIIYRLGSLSREEIEDHLGMQLQSTLKNDGVPEAPGMLSKHYAPRTSLILTKDINATMANYPNQKVGVLSFGPESLDHPCTHHLVLSPDENLDEAASRLYAGMHQLDHLELDVIVAKLFPDVGLGTTINDRLQRAAKT
jgi:L-threonylcarbamoyladenylate synthase